jgi:hypothetical protein
MPAVTPPEPDEGSGRCRPRCRTDMLGPVADFSGTPLRTKLGIEEGATLALIDAPGDVLSDLPASVVVKRRASGRAQVVVAFFTSSAKLDRRIDPLGSMIFPSGALWVAWPKRSSGKASDLSDNVVREMSLRRGLVDNKVWLHRRDVVGAQVGVAPRTPVAVDQEQAASAAWVHVRGWE